MKSQRKKHAVVWTLVLTLAAGGIYAWLDFELKKRTYIETTETYDGVVKYEVVEQRNALSAVKDEHNPFTHLNDLNYFGDIKIMPRAGSAKDLTDTKLREMANYLQTDYISLSDTAITNQGLKYLHLIKDLSIIDLSKTKVTDVGMTYLASIKGLQGLNLLETTISGKGIRSLRECENLNWLALSNFSLQSGGLEELAQLPKMTGLLLEAQDLTDDQVQLIVVMGQLVSLHFAKSNKLTNLGLSHISRMPNLKHLYLSPGSYDNQGIYTISRMQKLETLFIEAGAGVNDEALAFVDDMHNLQNAYISGPNITTVYDQRSSP
ncbi:MAG: hypothetical protein ACI9TH_000269 [Kiritimatiellia bacterium]|jgi:hypothetical protein